MHTLKERKTMKKIAIIGGGIIGATAAFYLSQLTNDHITVYDFPQGQATRASAGIISPWLSKRRNKKWYQLAKDGAHFYQKLVVDLALPDTIFSKSGVLLVRPEDSLSALEDLAHERIKDAPDMGEIQLLTGQQTKRLLPVLKEMPALYLTGGGRLDGAAYLQHVKQKATANQVTFVDSYATLEKASDFWQVKTDRHTATYDTVLLSPGPHLKKLLSPLGYDVDIRPQKGQLLCFQTPFKDSSQWPVAMLDGEADFIPFGHGKLLIGATHENEAGWDLTPTSEAYQSLATGITPFIDDRLTLEDYPVTYQVGTRAYTADFAPFFGALDEEPTLIVASGLGSSGLTTGPYIGYLLAQAIAQAKPQMDPYQKPLTNYLNKRL